MTRKRKGPELENGSRPKKLKTHETDNGKLISNQSRANAVQPRRNRQFNKAMDDRAKHKAALRLAKIERRKVRKENEKKLIAEAQKFDEETAGAQGSQKESKKIKKEREMSWKVSEIAGGRMLDLDPIFARNEEYCQLRPRTINAHILTLFSVDTCSFPLIQP